MSESGHGCEKVCPYFCLYVVCVAVDLWFGAWESPN